MIQGILRRSFFRILFLSISIFIILATTTATTDMKKNSDILTSLEKLATGLDYAVWISIAFSVVFGGLLLIVKSKLSDEQKKQNDSLQLNLANLEKERIEDSVKLKQLDIDFEKEKTKRAEIELALEKQKASNLSLKQSVAKHDTALATHTSQIGTLKFESKVIEDANKSIIPRHISDEDFEKVRLTLSQYDGNKKLRMVFVYGAGAEAQDLANRLFRLFKSAGWDVNFITEMSADLARGVRIYGNNNPDVKSKAFFIINAFEAIGFTLTPVLAEGMGVDNMRLKIGAK